MASGLRVGNCVSSHLRQTDRLRAARLQRCEAFAIGTHYAMWSQPNSPEFSERSLAQMRVPSNASPHDAVRGCDALAITLD